MNRYEVHYAGPHDEAEVTVISANEFIYDGNMHGVVRFFGEDDELVATCFGVMVVRKGVSDDQEPDFDGTDDELPCPLYRDYMAKVCPDEDPLRVKLPELRPEQVWWHPAYGVIRILQNDPRGGPRAIIEWSLYGCVRRRSGPPVPGGILGWFSHPFSAGGFRIEGPEKENA